jgi:hypothetical protein
LPAVTESWRPHAAYSKHAAIAHALALPPFQHAVLKQQKALEKMKGEIELFKELEKFKKFDGTSSAPREPIPEDVRMFVWRRDGAAATASDHPMLLALLD